jgi:hypothetical protein
LLAVVVASAFMLTLVACPEADVGKKKTGKNPIDVGEGVYSVSLKKDEISDAWGVVLLLLHSHLFS